MWKLHLRSSACALDDLRSDARSAPGSLVDPASDVLNIRRGQASHGDARVTRHVNVSLLDDPLDLFWLQTQVREHADLLDDVVPVATGCWTLEFVGQQFVQALSHVDDSAGHFLDVGLPLGPQLWVVEDHRHYPRSKGRWVGDFGTLDHRELAEDGCVLLDGGRDDVQSSHSLAVQTSVLGKGLANDDGDRLACDKVADTVGVSVEVTGSETLVGAVEKGEVLLALEDVSQCVPLLLGWVYARWVVSTGVQQEHGAVCGAVECLCQPVKVEADRLCVVPRVVDGLDAAHVEDGLVVGPCWVGDVDLLLSTTELVVVVEPTEEDGSQVVRSRTTDCLDRSDPVLCDGW